MGGESLKDEEHILITLPFPEPKEILDRLRKKYPSYTIVYRPVYFHRETFAHQDKVPDELYHNATVICTLSAIPESSELVPKLKFIHFISSGTDHVAKSPIYTDTDIPLTTSSGIAGPMISEWVVLQILSAAHRQRKLIEWQQEHKWADMREVGQRRDSVGQRLGVLGYGSIGRQAARLCKAMGMDVIAYTASPRRTPESKKDMGYIVPGTGDQDGSIPSAWYAGMDKESLHEFLSKDIDFLLVSVPLTKQTTHFIAEPEFRILGAKRNAFILNISRGSILNQDDLIKYLKKPLSEGGLRGAAVDVTDPEPLPVDHELWGLENVTITPHISGLSVAYEGRALDVLDNNLMRLAKGEPLINVVNRKRGY